MSVNLARWKKKPVINLKTNIGNINFLEKIIVTISAC